MEWFESLKVEDGRPVAERWSKWDRLLVAVLASTLVLALVFLFFPLLRQRQTLVSQIGRLDRELLAQEQRGRQLSREIEALQQDRAYIERVAREKLNLAAPGETIFQFGTSTPASSAPRQNR
jgi:cell division protein FtsB